MSVEKISSMPKIFSEVAKRGEHSYYRLYDSSGEYALAAVGERETVLELHLEVSRWSHSTRRMLHHDLNWLKNKAKNLGKRGIVGVKHSNGVAGDEKWIKFTRAYGFDEHETVQLAGMRID